VRLRRSDVTGPGISRRRRGRGWQYTGPDGLPVRDPEALDRIRALAVPPAWREVWLCPWPNGHIQAIGTDQAGRRQYRYHDAWQERRAREKHERVVTLAARLPRMRERLVEHLRRPGLTRDRVLAAAVRLLDLGFFRVGGEAYAEENNTFGLATIRREHVRVTKGEVVFEYTAKGSIQRVQSVADEDIRAVVAALLRRRGGGEELLAYRDGSGAWRDVRSDDVNSYLRDITGGEFSAKDFRTWHATVLMAVALARESDVPSSGRGRKKAVKAALDEVSGLLGNTPAVCRSSYVDPRVIEIYERGTTIAPALRRIGQRYDRVGSPLAQQAAVERAVLTLLRDAGGSRRPRARAVPPPQPPDVAATDPTAAGATPAPAAGATPAPAAGTTPGPAAEVPYSVPEVDASRAS